MSAGTNDPLLVPLIEAAIDDDRRRALADVMTRHVRPTVDRILARYRTDRSIGSPEAEDVAGIASLRLVRKLQNLAAGGEEPIVRLDDYTATVTYNAIYDVLRDRFPEWTRLKNRIRYTLTSDPRFAVWETAAGPACGAPEQRGSAAGALKVEADELATSRTARLGDLLQAILQAAG